MSQPIVDVVRTKKHFKRKIFQIIILVVLLGSMVLNIIQGYLVFR